MANSLGVRGGGSTHSDAQRARGPNDRDVRLLRALAQVTERRIKGGRREDSQSELFAALVLVDARFERVEAANREEEDGDEHESAHFRAAGSLTAREMRKRTSDREAVDTSFECIVSCKSVSFVVNACGRH